MRASLLYTLTVTTTLLVLCVSFVFAVGEKCQFLLSGLSCAAGEFNDETRPMPSFALTNWKDSIITWSGPRDNPNQEPVRPTGITSFRISADYMSSAIAQDTFAMVSDTGDSFLDPINWDGDAQLFEDGRFGTFMQVYNGSMTTSKYCISRSFFFPPQENFYIVEYNIGNKLTKPVTVSVLDFITTPPLSCSLPESALYSSSADVFTVDMTACSQPMYLAYGVFGGTQGLSYQVGSSSGTTSPLYQFANNGKLSNQASYSDKTVSIGTQTTITIPANSDIQLYFYRILQPNKSLAMSVNSRVTSQSASYWLTKTATSYSDWLALAKKPILDTRQEYLYKISLLATKNSMNPTSGSFVASFHPAYEFKVWARDSIFSAMILENAGYTEEPALFLKWLSKVELRDGGQGFHTCYSWFNGLPVGFVEPQYDSAGAALLAYYLHYKVTGDSSILTESSSRIREVEDFFLNNVQYGGLVPPDYSIWEESSDGITGEPIPPSHFTFTQSLAYTGLWAAAQIETVLGDQQRSQDVANRAATLQQGINKYLWIEGDHGYGYFCRSLDASTHLPDPRADGSTVAVIWGGACTNKTKAYSHLEKIIANLTKLEYGIARYWGDPFFYNSKWNPGGKEVGEASPPWPVVTMFTSWAELTLAESTNIPNVDSRLQWMTEHVARGIMPAGEAIDGVSGSIVMTSCPDLYEFAGVYAYTVLIQQGLCPPPNPKMWV